MLVKGSQSEPDVGAKKEIFFPLLSWCTWQRAVGPQAVQLRSVMRERNDFSDDAPRDYQGALAAPGSSLQNRVRPPKIFSAGGRQSGRPSIVLATIQQHD